MRDQNARSPWWRGVLTFAFQLAMACGRPAAPQAPEPVAFPAWRVPASPNLPAPSLAAVVGNATLELHDCRVDAEWAGGGREARDTGLPGPCAFVTTPSGPQVERTQQGNALLVVSSRPFAGRPGDCDTRVRVVLVLAGRLAVSTDQRELRLCGAEGPFDVATFRELAATSQ